MCDSALGGLPQGCGLGRPAKIALYSHDTQGLGHIRRNLLIARALCEEGARPTVLLLSGIHEAASFEMPPGVDCLTIPSLGKDTNGGYFPRSLGVSMDELIRIRGRTILAALQSFRPDAFIVDKVPLGAFNELLPSLHWLEKTDTSVILGLRDILDDPRSVAREWRVGKFEQAIRDFYDRIWVYGDRAVYDTAQEYKFAPDIVVKVRHAGYLNPSSGRAGVASRSSNGERSVLCVVGGGRDGLPLAESFLKSRLPDGARGVLITGPLMPQTAREGLRRLGSMSTRFEIEHFVTEPLGYLDRADAVIAMGGYNTMCEIVTMRKRALIVPRVEPRREQIIRAEQFARRGVVDVLHPDALEASALSRWMADSHEPRTEAYGRIDFGGTKRLPALLGEALAERRRGSQEVTTDAAR